MFAYGLFTLLNFKLIIRFCWLLISTLPEHPAIRVSEVGFIYDYTSDARVRFIILILTISRDLDHINQQWRLAG